MDRERGPEPEPEDDRHDELEHEPDAVPRRLLLGVAAGTVAITVVLCLVAWLVLRVREAKLRPSGQWPEAQLGPPHDVAGVREDVFEIPRAHPALVDEQRQRLSRYQWADRAHGVARIPIAQAIEIVLQQEARR